MNPFGLLNTGARNHRASGIPSLRLGERNTIFECEGPGMISHIWITFPPRDKMLGRRNLLRMFWDDEDDPSVEAPLSDFFGLPFGFSGAEYKLNSHYLTVAPNDALNCYFPMPFAKRARIEILPDQLESGGGFYFQVDYYRFERELPEDYRTQRFHAQFRFENPCERYGRNYLFLDAEGKGALVGATFGIEAFRPEPDAWFHGGGDSIFIDGESCPAVLHGIGAEDFFGHSWGVQPFQSPWVGVPWNETEGEGKGRTHRVSLYRFFVHDPVLFHTSIRGVLGAMGNGYSSVAYWYQDEPHRRFFRTPPSEQRLPESVAPYGAYDVEPDQPPEWQLLAPFPIDNADPFKTERPFETGETGNEEFVYEAKGKPSLPDGNRMKVKWVSQKPYRNFVDFNLVARPAISCICLQTGVVGYALRYVESPDAREVTAHFGFDDEAAVRVNDAVVYQGRHQTGFSQERFPVKLRKGPNRILVKLSNYDNTTWRLWAFSFRLVPLPGACEPRS